MKKLLVVKIKNIIQNILFYFFLENLIFKSYSGKNIFQPDFIEISNFKRSKENLIQTSESNTTLDSLGVKDEAE